MNRRQTSVPRQWLIADERMGDRLPAALCRLPRGSGVLLLYAGMPAGDRARLMAGLRRVARRRGLTIADECAGEAARVHNLPELRKAGLERIPLLFVSPMWPTRSHPARLPLARMRAAALVRLSKVPVIALGGMNERRFAAIGRLGFSGWAGIDSWLLKSLKSRGRAPFWQPKGSNRRQQVAPRPSREQVP